MPLRIVDPNREKRLIWFTIAGLFFAWGIYIVIAERIPALLLLIIPFAQIAVAVIVILIPHMTFCNDGIVIRRFLRNQTMPWTDVLKVEVNLVNPTKIDLSIRYSICVRLRGVRFPISFFFSIPLYRCLKSYYGTFDSDEIEKLNHWEQKYFHIDEDN